MKFTREQLEYLLADLNTAHSTDKIIGQVHAYSVGTFQVGERTLIHIKRVKDTYQVRLSVRVPQAVA